MVGLGVGLSVSSACVDGIPLGAYVALSARTFVGMSVSLAVGRIVDGLVGASLGSDEDETDGRAVPVVGVAEGSTETGSMVVFFDGLPKGLEEGHAPDGEAVGSDDGKRLGCVVGFGVGVCVGLGDAAVVVGLGVGLGVGFGVGFGVGLGVGLGVGVGVGFAVGPGVAGAAPKAYTKRSAWGQ